MLSVGKVVVFSRFVAIFSKKYGSFRPKSSERIIFGEILSAILRIKKSSDESAVAILSLSLLRTKNILNGPP